MKPDERFIETAIAEAGLSCCLSKRGALIWTGNRIVSSGHNYMPVPFVCSQDAFCKTTCHKRAIHAEQMALFHAGNRFPSSTYHLLHVKTVENKLVPSGPPSCAECSKLIVAAGIYDVWLYHEDGWKAYTSGEFNRLSNEGKNKHES